MFSKLHKNIIATKLANIVVVDEGKKYNLNSFSYFRAAGTFQYIHENFTNAPSMDLGPETLQMMVQLMCAQARECLFAKSRLCFTDDKVWFYIIKLFFYK